MFIREIFRICIEKLNTTQYQETLNVLENIFFIQKWEVADSLKLAYVFDN